MTYFPDQLAIVKRNLSTSGIDWHEVNFRVGKSWPKIRRAARKWETYSFVLCDGSHKLRHVRQGLGSARLVETGRVICLHDYHPKVPGVVAAVDRLLASHPEYQVFRQTGTLLILKKTGRAAVLEIGWRDRVRALVFGAFHQFAAGVGKRLQGHTKRAP